MKNTGKELEEIVFEAVENLVKNNQFVVANPHVRIFRQKGYYSKEREDSIKADVSVEKYLTDPDTDEAAAPVLLIILECKDWEKPVSVGAVEEFHAKLQQIGADNTKGILITRAAPFQKAAVRYAMSKGIGLARILPDSQVQYILYDRLPGRFGSMFMNREAESMLALTKKDYVSYECRAVFCLGGQESIEDYVSSYFEPCIS